MEWTLQKKIISQVIQSDPFGDFKWPFQGLSDLHLGYQKVTWKKLVINFILNLQESWDGISLGIWKMSLSGSADYKTWVKLHHEEQ